MPGQVSSVLQQLVEGQEEHYHVCWLIGQKYDYLSVPETDPVGTVCHPALHKSEGSCDLELLSAKMGVGP